ncbi:hypothetical protein [Pedobacter sp.]|uniref:hypothetical protein n=1 Tax=Pedobacter sp. TaxID=1411316 RepID=UPI003BADA56D
MKTTGIEIEAKIAERITANVKASVFFLETNVDSSYQFNNESFNLDYLLKCKSNFKNAILLASAMTL